MWFEEFLSTIGLADFLAEDYFLAQVGLLAATVVFFVITLALAVMSFRAANVAVRARKEAQTFLANANDLATEMRHLTAQVETTTRQGGVAAEWKGDALAKATAPQNAIEFVDALGHQDVPSPEGEALTEALTNGAGASTHQARQEGQSGQSNWDGEHQPLKNARDGFDAPVDENAVKSEPTLEFADQPASSQQDGLEIPEVDQSVSLDYASRDANNEPSRQRTSLSSLLRRRR